METIGPEFQNLLRGIQLRYTRFFALVLQREDSTLSQYNVLATLGTEGPLPMNQVAKKLHISKPAISRLVERLEAESLIARKAHSSDRRIVLLHLTAKGRSMIQRVQKRMLDFASHTFASISPEERETIRKFYELLHQEFDRVLAS